MVQMNFDSNQVEPDSGAPEALPAGQYVAAACATDLKKNKSGTGMYLEIEFDVLDGPHAGRKFWNIYNTQHQNPEAARIGNAQLSALLRAIGLPVMQDTEQMHGRPALFTLGVEFDNRDKDLPAEQRRKKNRVKKVEPVGGVAPPPPAQQAAAPAANYQPQPAAQPAHAAAPAQPQQAGQVQPTGAKTPPWKR